jgi:MFS family permease
MMSEATESAAPVDARPPLWSDRSFWGLNVTQFLGAFNDNLFKELVLLLCVDQVVRHGGADQQALAGMLFSIPFILFSGYAGYLADRWSKRTLILACKLAEVAIVLIGMAALASGQLPILLGVLFLMGTHSAFFGPPKYGALPELFRQSDLPRVNGLVLMATFLAIILGLSAAGAVLHFGKQWWGDRLWPASLVCLVAAIVGVVSAWQIRGLPPAEPQLRFRWSTLVMTPETFALLRQNRLLRGVLIMSSLFWFVGGMVYPPAINAFGKVQLGLSDLATGALAASTGIGIAGGCVLAGYLSRSQVRGWVIRLGAWGLFGCLAVLAIPGGAAGGTALGVAGSVVALIGVGIFAGCFSVPLQVLLQSQAPLDQKGRIIAAMNLLNWVGIAVSQVVYSVSDAINKMMGWPPSATFGVGAGLMLLMAVLYRPPRLVNLQSDEPAAAP